MMTHSEVEESRPLVRAYLRSVLSTCPECGGDLAVLRVIGGRAGCEYWTMRCSDCGGIHLDILGPFADDDGPRPAS